MASWTPSLPLAQLPENQGRQQRSASYPFDNDLSPISLLAGHQCRTENDTDPFHHFGSYGLSAPVPASLRYGQHHYGGTVTRNRVRSDVVIDAANRGIRKEEVSQTNRRRSDANKYDYREVMEMDSDVMDLSHTERRGQGFGYGQDNYTWSRRVSTTTTDDSEPSHGSYIDLSADLDPDEYGTCDLHPGGHGSNEDPGTSPVPDLMHDLTSSMDSILTVHSGYTTPRPQAQLHPDYTPTSIPANRRYRHGRQPSLERCIMSKDKLIGRASHIFHPDLHAASDHASSRGLVVSKMDKVAQSGWAGKGFRELKLEQWRMDLLAYAEDD